VSIVEKQRMWVENLRSLLILAMTAGLAAFAWVGGCAAPAPGPGGTGPVFFPPPPERPRLQFLTSFSGPTDVGVAGPSDFEKFVLGEAKEREGIATPYGLAIHDGKLYVCDVGKRRVEVLDLQKRSFGTMTEDRRLLNPVNIHIEPDGTKYVADPTAGAVFVFGADDALRAILGKGQKISPIDVTVRGPYCYVTDFASNQVVVLDKVSGKEIRRLGEKGEGDKQFQLISDLAFGPDGDLYVTDKLKARIFQFDQSGNLKRTIGKLGDNIDELVRPKGIAIDRENRIWVVDAGVSLSPSAWSTEVAKIYDQQGRLLLFFGRPGRGPGNMNLPTQIILDYDNVDLFRRYAAQGANLEFLVFVSNQYGPNKVNVYGFGEFPTPNRAKEAAQLVRAEPSPQPSEPSPQPSELSPQPVAQTAPTPSAGTAGQAQSAQGIAALYYHSMDLYRAGRLAEARAGFVKVIDSGLIPPPMVQTLRSYIQDIDDQLARERGGRP
jgi:DNA-binding beta-propeller fold protein YncE